MLVRTYGRRTRGGAASDDGGGDRDVYVIDSDSGDDESDTSSSPPHLPPFSQPQSSSQENPNPTFLSYLSAFSSQDSSSWSLDPDSVPSSSNKVGLGTASLMEAQEFGEMMELRDDVDFAIEGLRPGKTVRIRRASLHSLLNACGTPHQRQLLRAHGLAKKIIDALMSLNFDDQPCSAAAAALFFVFANDAQNDQFLNSPSSIRFLLKLINPPKSTVEARAPSVGAKLLGLSRIKTIAGPDKVDDDSSSEELMAKVEEVLLNCKELKRVDGDCGKRPELSSKWIALLTMEKACLSAVSLEDMSDKGRKLGGSFKEKMRELGGLNTIFDLLVSYQSVLESYMKSNSPSSAALKDSAVQQSITILLKCFKIMENATFLSKDNQDHLLKMGRRLSAEASQRSFVGVVISVIKHLSDLSLAQGSSCTSCPVELKSSDADMTENRRGSNGASSSTIDLTEDDAPTKAIKFSLPNKRRKMSPSQSEASLACPSSLSSDGPSGRSIGDRFRNSCVGKAQVNTGRPKFEPKKFSERLGSMKSLRLGRNPDGLCKRPHQSGSMKNSLGLENLDQFEFDGDSSESSGLNLQKWSKESCKNQEISENVISSLTSDSFDEFEFDGNNQNSTVKVKSLQRISKELCKKQPGVSEYAERGSSIDESDPFEFDGDGIGPSKWEKQNLKNEPLRRCEKKRTKRGSIDDQFDLAIVRRENNNLSQPIDVESQSLSQPSFQEESTVLEDCLLASVQVLINLTNDNPTGCQQIATCGGLDVMASLIIKHFPMFGNSNSNGQTKKNKRLRDHELDLLVAILGLLVNLVEKDSLNRLRLASPCVSSDQPGNSDSGRGQRDLIPLFCGIFLSNQGAEDVSGDKEIVALDDAEEYLLQGEKEAEKMILEAYSALLLAFLSTESTEVREAIASCLPNNNLMALVPVLERFVAFHLSLNMISAETHSAVTEVIKSCKVP
ncbi:WAPL (Wings apart-like protein regulation of heterochromatin) protein [Rhynchospora pubera]|uniref:WAPL (Wings apart-like protein regulation of heterochromatin) protein n=1 Tax=Rhynchospora pubera TaxID=906938 RepID=A0AAV8DYU2_9POAL|nr:WAPL (Wings apart-like protein regulation of heterochromatin) protein [Rhynchospora pubera]